MTQITRRRLAPLIAAGPLLAVLAIAFAKEKERDTAAVQREAAVWRQEHRLIDLHFHVAYQEDKLARAVKIMDEVGIGVAVNLSGSTTVASDGQPSAFERNKTFADSRYPGRFVHYMNLDYGRWNEPDFAEHAVHQIEEGHRLGAAGLKEYKRLGLYLKNDAGALINVDDPKLDPVWKRCGELASRFPSTSPTPRPFGCPTTRTTSAGSNSRTTALGGSATRKSFRPTKISSKPSTASSNDIPRPPSCASTSQTTARTSSGWSAPSIAIPT